MTMDVATNLDPRDRGRARGVADWSDRLRHLHLRVAARRCARRWPNMPAVELPPTTTTSHEVVVPGATGHDPTVRVYSPPTDGDRPTVRLLDPRRRLHVRLRPHDRRPRSTAGSRSSTASRCRSSTASRPRTRTRRRSTTATRGCSGPRSTPTSWASTRPASRSPARARVAGSRRGSRSWRATAARSPLAFQLLIYPMIDDRNTTRVEPHRGRAGLEPRRQPPGLARLPRRARRHRRRPGLRGAGAGRRRRRASRRRGSASARSTSSATRTSSTRRGCSRAGMPDRAARVPGRAARLRDDRARRRGVARRASVTSRRRCDGRCVRSPSSRPPTDAEGQRAHEQHHPRREQVRRRVDVAGEVDQRRVSRPRRASATIATIARRTSSPVVHSSGKARRTAVRCVGAHGDQVEAVAVDGRHRWPTSVSAQARRSAGRTAPARRRGRRSCAR